MPTKKYNNGRRKENHTSDNEIFGIVLVIISAFILLCIVVRPILGIISKGIFNVTIGVFGLFSYPLFLCTLLWGIALIQGRSANLRTRYKAGIVCMTVSLMFILQLATTHALLKESFSAYISGTYHGITAGGVLFGVVAYGIQTVVTPIVSYIVFSLVFVCSAVFFFLLPILNKRKELQREEQPFAQNAPAFVKGNAEPRPIRPLNDTTLFVDTIRPPQQDSFEHSDQFVPLGKFDETPHSIPVPQKKTVDFQPYSTATQKTSEKDGFKSEAHRILFGDQKRILSDMAQQSSPQSGDNTSSGYGYNVLPPLYTAPDIKSAVSTESISQTPATTAEPVAPVKPQKRVHISDIPGLNEIPVLPEKDISNQIVGGTGIINGDDFSRKLAETLTPIQKDQSSAPTVSEKKAETLQQQPQEDVRPSIVNGDYFGMPNKSAPRVTPPKIAPIPVPPVATPAKTYAQSSYEQTQLNITAEEKEEEICEQAPIISGSAYESTHSAESRFQQLLDEERQRASVTPSPVKSSFENFAHEREYDVTESFADKLSEEDDSLFADELPEQPRESALKIDDEPIDLSEQSHFEGADSTGYYETVSLADIKPVKSAQSAVQPTVRSKGQLGIDDISPNIPMPPKPKKRKKLRYNAPDIDMLISSTSVAPEDYNVACEEKARLLEETLQGLKLPVKVGAITRGPAVTRYELEMPPGIPIKRIEQFSTDIEYYLESNGKIRIEAPIPGKRAVGIEVPNEKIDIVCLRDIISSKEFQNSSSPLTLSLGKDIAGTNIVCNLEKMPHLLIAGATGSGKSACLNSIIMSIMYKSSPEEVRLILIDPKRVEFNMYQGIPHLLGSEIINDAQQAINALTWAKEEMDRRYILFGSHKVRNLPEFNKSDAVKSGEEQKLPYIVLIVDELAELMLDNNKKVLETKIMSMAQKARAAGIHLILATQRPSVDVITGTIKANLPSRIAFSVKSIVDSRTILDQCGAETLLGRGDMLYAPIGLDDPKRVQGAFVTEQEITAVTEYVRANNEVDFDDEFTAAITKRDEEPETSDEEDDDNKEFDSLMPEVLKCVIESGSASTSMIQRRFSVGYARASRIIDQMELHKFIGPLEGSKPRAVYISREQYRELFGIDL
ncbi:MAG: hypothetical protein HFE47_01045 [Clostridia bacterium]|nr:hypothetical protein [Clostridia bacterium]